MMFVVALMQTPAEVVATPAALGAGGLRSFVALGAVAALLALAVWGLGRFTQSRRGRQPITVESAVALGDKRSLVIVSVEGRRLLVGLAPGGVSLVTELHASFGETLADSLRAEGPQ
ncbi:MAG TPA: flagellar biosynthetic protein FliO [Vicinamibacterales bacterium]|nr:flagellar biosynthetic protein FliO [Vicinamibacterales bacterium]